MKSKKQDENKTPERQRKSGVSRSTAVIGTFALLFIFNCNEQSEKNLEANERYKVQNYRCSEEQFKSVKRDFDLCSKTGYFDSDCLKMAKQTYCDYIGFTSANCR